MPIVVAAILIDNYCQEKNERKIINKERNKDVPSEI